jgi:hypothetical protein
LDGLKSKEPYSRTELNSALGALKNRVRGVSFTAKPHGDKWIVTASGGGKKKGGASQLELKMKMDGAVSSEAQMGLAALNQVTDRYAAKGATLDEMTAAIKAVRRKFAFKSITVAQKDGFWYFHYEINPTGDLKGPPAVASSVPALLPVGSWIENLKEKSYERVVSQSSVVHRTKGGEQRAVRFQTTKPDGGRGSFTYASEGIDWKRHGVFIHKSKYVMPEGGASAGFVLMKQYRGSKVIRPTFYEDSQDSRRAIVNRKLPGLLHPTDPKQFLSEGDPSKEAAQGYTQTLHGKALVPVDVASPDHDPSIAEHWSRHHGNQTKQHKRLMWNQNVNNYKIMSLKLNLSLGSRGEVYTDRVGIDFGGSGE